MKGLDIGVANEYDFMVKYPEGQSLGSYQYSNPTTIDHNVLAIHRSKRTGKERKDDPNDLYQKDKYNDKEKFL